MSLIEQSLIEYWLTEMQAKTFITIFQYGPKPASSIAKIIWVERTNTYKTIQVLIQQWLIWETTKDGVKQFFVPDKEVFRKQLEQRQKTMEETEKKLPIIEAELAKIEWWRISPLPKMRFFEWLSGIENLFDDIITTIKNSGYLVIKCFASNTIESQSQSSRQLNEIVPFFFSFIQKKQVRVETLLWNWVLTLENTLKTYDLNTLWSLPWWNNAVHMFVVWELFYIAIFKDVPIWIKIESPEVADIMHFLLKQMN